MTEPLFWTPAGLAGRAGVSLVTLRRWKRTGRLPAWARILIALLSGELDLVDKAFRGWIIRRGELVSPEGWCFTPGEIRSIPLLYGVIREWRGRALGAEASARAVAGVRISACEDAHATGASETGRFSAAAGAASFVPSSLSG